MSDALPPIRIHRQRRRNLLMKVTPVGVVVFIPRHLSERSKIVQAFIADGLRKLKPRALPQPETPHSRAVIERLVQTWAERMGVQPGRVQMRAMYRKWGSCSSAGNITLNTALYRVPLPLVEYIVCHELVHLRVFGHGKAFKAEMDALMPDWRERDEALNALLGPAVD